MNIRNEMFALIKKMYPICRSITGEGVRETLKIIQEHIPLQMHEIPTGTKVFDWEVPREWNIKDAYIKDKNGNKVVDFKESNLHVVNYSVPVHTKLNLIELKKHLYTIPEFPEWIPYRTSYYSETWGFCLSHNQLKSMKDEEYEIYINSTLDKGHLTYGECVIKGATDDEVLLSAHICHPSLANDNLSGIAVLVQIANYLLNQSNRFTYRLIFAPGTIGSIAWLSKNGEKIKNIKHGLIVSCVGDSGNFTYKCSRDKNAEINHVVSYALKNSGYEYVVEDFSPYGYDERQYCSPGINLPVGLFERSKYGTFPEYHTSADNLDFIHPRFLTESYEVIKSALKIIDRNKAYKNLLPKCEPQLGKRGLYHDIGGDQDKAIKQLAILWILNQSDGTKTLLDISNTSGIDFETISNMACLLEENGLVA